MSSATIAIDSEASVTHSELGWSFIHWGLGLFIAGFVVGYVPIVHYIVGAQAGNIGPVFLKNITLWWGCPGILAEMIVKHGSLGMLGIGLCYLAAARQGSSSIVSSHERIAVKLCAYGLIAESWLPLSAMSSATRSGRTFTTSPLRRERMCGSPRRA